MSSSLELYNDSCSTLARTMKIHSKILAVECERRVGMLEGNIDWAKRDKREWRYYQNLAGNYHHTDEKMVIISLDTLEEIEFTKENLADSLNTKEAYVYGSNYYNALVKRYPEQEHLILSILHPVDIEQAIVAPDYKILGWISEYIEPQESRLINQIQKWIYTWVDRFDNRSYASIYPNLITLYNGVLQSHLAEAIKVIRIENTRTSQVHSFHLWAYLDSNGWLSKYKSWLSHEQAMFLYWNIHRIRKYAGTQEIFKDLVTHFLTASNIPIYGTSFRHLLTELKKELKPEVEVARTYINHYVDSKDLKSTTTLKKTLEREIPLGIDKGVNFHHDLDVIEHDLEFSRTDDIQSRIFDSEIDDGGVLYDYCLADFLLSHWIDKVGDGSYTGRVVVENTSDGRLYQLTVGDAFILWWYCKLKVHNIEPTIIPKFQSLIAYSGLIQPRSFFNEFADDYYIKQWYVDTILDHLPRDYKVANKDVFFKQTKDKFLFWKMVYFLTLSLPRATARSRGTLLMNNLWHRSTVTLAKEGTTFANWLSSRGIELENATTYDFKQMADAIFHTCTGGYDIKGEDRSVFQKVMLEIVGQFSPYNLQFLQTRKGAIIQSCGFTPLTYSAFTPDVRLTAPILLPDIDLLNAQFVGEEPLSTRYNLTNCIRKSKWSMELDPELGTGIVDTELDYKLEINDSPLTGVINLGVGLTCKATKVSALYVIPEITSLTLGGGGWSSTITNSGGYLLRGEVVVQLDGVDVSDNYKYDWIIKIKDIEFTRTNTSPTLFIRLGDEWEYYKPFPVNTSVQVEVRCYTDNSTLSKTQEISIEEVSIIPKGKTEILPLDYNEGRIFDFDIKWHSSDSHGEDVSASTWSMIRFLDSKGQVIASDILYGNGRLNYGQPPFEDIDFRGWEGDGKIQVYPCWTRNPLHVNDELNVNQREDPQWLSRECGYKYDIIERDITIRSARYDKFTIESGFAGQGNNRKIPELIGEVGTYINPSDYFKTSASGLKDCGMYYRYRWNEGIYYDGDELNFRWYDEWTYVDSTSSIKDLPSKIVNARYGCLVLQYFWENDFTRLNYRDLDTRFDAMQRIEAVINIHWQFIPKVSNLLEQDTTLRCEITASRPYQLRDMYLKRVYLTWNDGELKPTTCINEGTEWLGNLYQELNYTERAPDVPPYERSYPIYRYLYNSTYCFPVRKGHDDVQFTAIDWMEELEFNFTMLDREECIGVIPGCRDAGYGRSSGHVCWGRNKKLWHSAISIEITNPEIIPAKYLDTFQLVANTRWFTCRTPSRTAVLVPCVYKHQGIYRLTYQGIELAFELNGKLYHSQKLHKKLLDRCLSGKGVGWEDEGGTLYIHETDPEYSTCKVITTLPPIMKYSGPLKEIHATKKGRVIEVFQFPQFELTQAGLDRGFTIDDFTVGLSIQSQSGDQDNTFWPLKDYNGRSYYRTVGDGSALESIVIYLRLVESSWDELNDRDNDVGIMSSGYLKPTYKKGE